MIEPFLKKSYPLVEAIFVHALILSEYFLLFEITFTVPNETSSITPICPFEYIWQEKNDKPAVLEAGLTIFDLETGSMGKRTLFFEDYLS